MAVLALAFAAIAAPTCRAPGGGFDPSSMDLTLFTINNTQAKCQDGTDAKMYIRPCCDGIAPGDHCNATDRPRWFIVFGDGNADGWCWDAASCAARAKNLTSSEQLPQHFSRHGGFYDQRVGAFSKSGEGELRPLP